MSLNIYRRREDVPDIIKLVRNNDLYFVSSTIIPDTEFARMVLADIECGNYVSQTKYMGRDKDAPLRKDYLSTGSKTLFNIAEHKDICFDVCECGDNALALLPFITDGNILWKNVINFVERDVDCDIRCNSKIYKSYLEFLDAEWGCTDEV